MTTATAPAPVEAAASAAPLTEREQLIAAAREWGYFTGSIKTRRDLWRGRRMLDVGMGAGPHSISFIEGGAVSYVGVDPFVGTTHVRDFRNQKDPTHPGYHAFPFTTDDIMRIYPNVHLYSNFLEDAADQVRQHKVDIAILAAVTEHLQHPAEVIRSIWEVLDRRGLLWISHCNYYSWSGHHRLPRSVERWDTAKDEQNKHVDWQHLEPTHPDYVNKNFNRVRVEDLRVLIAKYFEIVEWKVVVHALPRLTPEIRNRWKQYSLEELLGQNFYITARRRDLPLDIDLSDRQFHHPSADYLAYRDYSEEPIEPYELCNSVYFSRVDEICSHTDNNSAGLRVFARLKPGDKIVLRKFTYEVEASVAEIVQPVGGQLRIKISKPVAPELIEGNHDQWTIEF